MTRLPRPVSFLPGAGLAGYGWSQAGDPFHLYGLAFAVAAGELLWPALLLFIIFGLPACLLGCWPRPWRKWWRARNPGLLGWVIHWIVGSPIGRAGAKSAYIAKWMVRVVHAADGWCCVFCGSDLKIAIDHVGPWSLGYLTALFNMMTLCGRCNRIKSNAWIFHPWFRPWGGRFWPGRSADPQLAEEILRWELLYRWNPLRYIRAAWALGG